MPRVPGLGTPGLGHGFGAISLNSTKNQAVQWLKQLLRATAPFHVPKKRKNIFASFSTTYPPPRAKPPRPRALMNSEKDFMTGQSLFSSCSVFRASVG